MNEKTQSKSTVIQIPLDDIKPKSGDSVSNAKNEIETEEPAVDQPDQGCSGCSSKVENKESISMNSSSDTEPSLNLNKKSTSIAYKGMMDIALLTANANQLRFLISYNSEEKTFYISATLIVLSLVIQLAVGIAIIFRRRLKQQKPTKAEKLGSFILCGIFCLAVLNILVVSFTTTTATASAPTTKP